MAGNVLAMEMNISSYTIPAETRSPMSILGYSLSLLRNIYFLGDNDLATNQSSGEQQGNNLVNPSENNLSLEVNRFTRKRQGDNLVNPRENKRIEQGNQKD